jgi:hypothetical protein
MKKLLVLLALAAILAPPALARDFTQYAGPYSTPTPGDRSDVELEYDGDAWYGYGTSPNWTDESVVNFEAPAGGPFVVAEVRYYVIGTEEKAVHFWDSPDLNSPPAGSYVDGPLFSTAYSTWPPTDWTNVDVTGMAMVVNTGDIIAPGCVFYGTDDGIGLATYDADGNPGHSWVLYSGAWEDDTYVWQTDDGIRLGLNYGGGTPVQETTWGQVKSLFR